MKIILFSQNSHKVAEISSIFVDYEVIKYSDIVAPFSVIESGDNFKENAILKVSGLREKIGKNLQQDSILMAEDSGICIEALGGKPGIFSARFANISDFNDKDSINNACDASDEANIDCVINAFKSLNIESSNACFISCVAVLYNDRVLSTHGFLSGKVVNFKSGKNGFGYDPIFVPNGFDSTLASLDSSTKNAISHRFYALDLMKILLQ